MSETKQRTILLVEDDERTREAVRTVLSANGYRVLATDLVASAWHMFLTEKPDLAILDVGLPDGDGISFCGKMRGNKELGSLPVIMLTAKGEFEDKAAGFHAGADQYLVKPVSPKEIMLWVQSLLRRLEYDKEDGDVLRVGEVEIDIGSHLVRFRGHTVTNLTTREFDLLYYLAKRRPRIISRKEILSRLWHTIATDHVIDTHMTNLRRKLPQEVSDRIQAVPGKGYRYL